jgi:predicted 3-demethylubiquinone-9 3-methyltransferase (glyoxalase superfamily)
MRRVNASQEDTMAIAAQKITPCLWFDTEAEQAANFYVSIFKDSKIGSVNRYNKAGHDVHGKPAGSVMAVEFEIEGQRFVALNGGPQFKFDEAVSFQIHCKTQEEIDYYWSRLTDGGREVACGWLKDKFGLSWQVIPTALPQMLMDENSDKAQRVMRSMLQMRKIDLAALKRAQAA